MRFLLAVLVLAAAGTVRGQGTSEAIRGFNTGITGSFAGTAGWTFQPAANITVTELGCLADFFVSNTYTSVQVGLWGPTGLLLASNSISLGSTSHNQSLYAPVTGVTLASGSTYHIGVYVPSATFSLYAVVPSQGGSVSNSTDIVSLKAAQTASSGWGSPTEVAGVDPGSAYLGPNFQYTGGVPEPSAGALLLLGAVLLGARWKR